MGWKVYDYQCSVCKDFIFEELVNDDVAEVRCHNDPNHSCQRVMSAPSLSFVALGDDAARRAESLKKRSYEHTASVVMKEAAERAADKAPIEKRKRRSTPKNKVKK